MSEGVSLVVVGALVALTGFMLGAITTKKKAKRRK